MSDVVEIVLESFAEGSISAEAVDLRPSGHTGFDILSEHVATPVFSEVVDEVESFRSWADE